MPNIDKRRDLHAYREKVRTAKVKARRLAKRGIKTYCTWCLQSIDPDLPAQHGRALTLDHPIALVDGGHVVNQVLVLMHRSCNAKKFHAERRATQGRVENTTRDW